MAFANSTIAPCRRKRSTRSLAADPPQWTISSHAIAGILEHNNILIVGYFVYLVMNIQPDSLSSRAMNSLTAAFLSGHSLMSYSSSLKYNITGNNNITIA